MLCQAILVSIYVKYQYTPLFTPISHLFLETVVYWSEDSTLKLHGRYIPFQDDKIQQDPNQSSAVFVTHDQS